MSDKMLVAGVSMSLLVLNALDFWSTVVVMGHGGVELNWLPAIILSSGIGAFFVFKLVAGSLGIIVLWILSLRDGFMHGAYRLALCMGWVFLTLVVAWNTGMLMHTWGWI